MTTHAGQMSNTPAVYANPQWTQCNGQPLYVLYSQQPQRGKGTLTLPATGDRRDYVRNVGWQGRRRGLGPLGWIICMPYDPAGAYYVATATDDVEATLSNPPTVGKPPAGIK